MLANTVAVIFWEHEPRRILVLTITGDPAYMRAGGEDENKADEEGEEVE
jgi:hypothetical protein